MFLLQFFRSLQSIYNRNKVVLILIVYVSFLIYLQKVLIYYYLNSTLAIMSVKVISPEDVVRFVLFYLPMIFVLACSGYVVWFINKMKENKLSLDRPAGYSTMESTAAFPSRRKCIVTTVLIVSLTLFTFSNHIYTLLANPIYFLHEYLPRSGSGQWMAAICIIFSPLAALLSYLILLKPNGFRLTRPIIQMVSPLLIIVYVQFNAYTISQQIKHGYKTAKVALVYKDGRQLKTNSLFVYIEANEDAFLFYDRIQNKVIPVSVNHIDRDQTQIEEWNLFPILNM